MRIKNIEEVNEVSYDEGLMDIIINVEIEPDVASRWELSEPKIWAVYRKYGDMRLDYLELVDNGVNVHGFEFTDEEKNKIVNYIENKFADGKE